MDQETQQRSLEQGYVLQAKLWQSPRALFNPSSEHRERMNLLLSYQDMDIHLKLGSVVENDQLIVRPSITANNSNI